MPQEAVLRHVGRTLLPAAAGPGERLYQEFLAGRSPNTLNAYRQDLAAFAAFQDAGSQGEALEALISLRAGEGNARRDQRQRLHRSRIATWAGIASVPTSFDHGQLSKRCRSKPPRIALALIRGRKDTDGQIGAQHEGIE
jgi:hypothetical protein